MALWREGRGDARIADRDDWYAKVGPSPFYYTRVRSEREVEATLRRTIRGVDAPGRGCLDSISRRVNAHLEEDGDEVDDDWRLGVAEDLAEDVCVVWVSRGPFV